MGISCDHPNVSLQSLQPEQAKGHVTECWCCISFSFYFVVSSEVLFDWRLQPLRAFFTSSVATTLTAFSLIVRKRGNRKAYSISSGEGNSRGRLSSPCYVTTHTHVSPVNAQGHWETAKPTSGKRAKRAVYTSLTQITCHKRVSAVVILRNDCRSPPCSGTHQSQLALFCFAAQLTRQTHFRFLLPGQSRVCASPWRHVNATRR